MEKDLIDLTKTCKPLREWIDTSADYEIDSEIKNLCKNIEQDLKKVRNKLDDIKKFLMENVKNCNLNITGDIFEKASNDEKKQLCIDSIINLLFVDYKIKHPRQHIDIIIKDFTSKLKKLCVNVRDEDKNPIEKSINILIDRLIVGFSFKKSIDYKYIWNGNIEDSSDEKWKQISKNDKSLTILIPILPIKSLFVLQHIYMLKDIWYKWSDRKGNIKIPSTHIYWNELVYEKKLSSTSLYYPGIKEHFEFWEKFLDNGQIKVDIIDYFEDNFLSSIMRILLKADWNNKNFQQYILQIKKDNAHYRNRLETLSLNDSIDVAVDYINQPWWNAIVELKGQLWKKIVKNRLVDIFSALEKENSGLIVIFMPILFAFPIDIALKIALKEEYKKKWKKYYKRVCFSCYVTPPLSDLSFLPTSYSYYLKEHKNPKYKWETCLKVFNENLGKYIMANCLSKINKKEWGWLTKNNQPYSEIVKHVKYLFESAEDDIISYMRYL